jgi:hypothetical protein
MNDDTQTLPQAAEGAAPPAVTTLDLTGSEAVTSEVGLQAPPAVTLGQTEGAVTTTVATIPPHTAAAASGVLSTLKSDLEKEFAKGQSHFLTWIKAKLTELEQHLKV